MKINNKKEHFFIPIPNHIVKTKDIIKTGKEKNTIVVEEMTTVVFRFLFIFATGTISLIN